MRELIEARCPNAKCSKIHQVVAVNGEIINDAFCPPSKLHRGWRLMVPNSGIGGIQVRAKKARTA